MLEKQINFFKEEISIINPKIIVGMGRDCYNLLKTNFGDLKIPIKYIFHYHYAKRFEKTKEFDSQIKEIKRVLNS